MRKKRLTIMTQNKLNVDSKKDDDYVLSYIAEEEDGAIDNISSWHPMNCNEFGLYNIVEYYVYAEDDICLEIKSITQSLPNLKLVYMNGPDLATYVDVNTEKMYTFKVNVKGLSINNIYFKNIKNALKFLNGFEVF